MSVSICPASLAFRLLLGFAFVIALAVSAKLVHGEEPAAPVAAVAGSKKLTSEELKTICENLGYEPEADTVDGKINLLILQWKQGTFQFVLYVSVAADGNDIIVQAPLKKLPDSEAAYGKELATVMSKGFFLTPSHFVVDETRSLRLIRFVPNRDLNAAKIRKAFTDFTEQVRASESVWRCDRWEVKPTVVAKPVVPQLEGAWKVGSINGGDVAARQIQITFGANSLTFSENGKSASPISVRVSEGEGTIDMVNAEGQIEKGRFTREGNKAKFAFAAPGGERPTDYSAKAGVTVVEMELAAK